VLTAAATTVTLNAGSALDVLATTGKFGEATQTDTKVSVTGSNSGKAKVEANSTVWTVTDDSTGTDISSSDKIVLGTLTLDFNGTSAVTDDACAASDSAAAGKLVVGAGTTITFKGTD
jgi:hypothetical protein